MVAFKKHFDSDVKRIRPLKELQQNIFSIKSMVKTLQKESL